MFQGRTKAGKVFFPHGKTRQSHISFICHMLTLKKEYSELAM